MASSPASLEVEGRSLLDPGGGGWLRNPHGAVTCKVALERKSRCGQKRAGGWGGETEGNHLGVKGHTQVSLQQKATANVPPEWQEYSLISLPLTISLNEEVV